MKRKRLNRDFYTRPTLKVAKKLLGKYIVCIWRGKRLEGMITETEAYIGPHDRASHSYKWKRTPRNLAEYMEGGHIYIYLVYGMYWQLNISTFRERRPECVLIRALAPVPADKFKIQKFWLRQIPQSGTKCKMIIQNSKLLHLADGPGKVCRYLKLDKSFYGEDLIISKRIWLEDKGVKIPLSKIKSSARIGIEYAGPYWSRRKWRFYIN